VHGRRFAGEEWVLGEDSGIEVEALGGGPGVHSARFARGEPVERLLAELEQVEGNGRRARYVCELVALARDGHESRGTGVLEGRIADEPRGSEGFGYDPIFVPSGEERTVAELGNDWKRENSHRARAARDLLRDLGEAGRLL
jgi:XTP/dITP diphosphohydrolase